jgi:hypothetical protein
MKISTVALITGVSLCLANLPLNAAQLRLSDGTTTVLVDDNSPQDANPIPGYITYSGGVGPLWGFTVTIGITKPLDGSPTEPFLDLDPSVFSSDAAHLVLEFTETNFTASGTATYDIGGSSDGTVSYSVYMDPANQLFGETTLLTAMGPFGNNTHNAPFNQTTTGTIAASGPYSITLKAVIDHVAAGHTGFDADTEVVGVCNGTIGDFVWDDVNGNGCQDAGEPGIPGVTVNLYAGCSPAGALIASTNTDSNGKYLFGNLCPGSYTVSFVTPVGFNRTISHASCDGSGNPTPTTDSDCTCDAAPCGVCVTLPTTGGSMTDLTIDCGYVPQTPSLSLSKTASANTVKPGQAVTYYYCVTNTGTMEIDNINIVDDNGTPGDSSDDYTVNSSPFNLSAGQMMCFAVSHITEATCTTVNGTNLTTGSLTVNVLANGNVEVFYNQSQGLNDNRYGTNATAATGWVTHTHKFSDLTGSDEATFLFTDGNGKTVLEFQEDYISAATSAKFGDGVTINYPSGYGTLGPLGGDGKPIIGSVSNVLSARSTLSDTLNQSPTFYGYIVNSPKETSPLSNVSVPAGWNYTDGYYVLVSSNAFGAAGFGTVGIANVHNSPSKGPADQVSGTNVCTCVTNVAVATGVAVGGTSISANDFEIVCATSGGSGGTSGACSLAVGAIKFDKATIQIPIKDNGSANVILNTLTLANWPAANGKLKTVTLNGNAYGGPGAALLGPTPPTVILGTGGTAWSGPNATPRTINANQSKTLVLTFEKNVVTTPASYTGWSASFGTDPSCNLSIFP